MLTPQQIKVLQQMISPIPDSPTTYPSWDELTCMSEGTTLLEWKEDNIRCVIKRGTVSLCAYVGVPIGHPLSYFDYDELPLEVHGGLTFSKEGDGEFLPAGYFWYGWDYGHSGDELFKIPMGLHFFKGTRWGVQDVQHQVIFAVQKFSLLMKLSEKIASHVWISDINEK